MPRFKWGDRGPQSFVNFMKPLPRHAMQTCGDQTKVNYSKFKKWRPNNIRQLLPNPASSLQNLFDPRSKLHRKHKVSFFFELKCLEEIWLKKWQSNKLFGTEGLTCSSLRRIIVHKGGWHLHSEVHQWRFKFFGH